MPFKRPNPGPVAEKEPAQILIVEDNILQRFTLAEWLRSCGHVVLEAISADEATIVLASTQKVDLVITDVWMPGMLDGFDLVRYIRRAFPRLQIIVVSGVYTTPEKEEFITYFKKPFDLQEVSVLITTLLAKDQGDE